MPALDDLFRQIQERTQQNYQAQQMPDAIQALQRVAGISENIRKQQEEQQNFAVEQAFKKAQTAKVNAEVDVQKQRTMPIKPEASQLMASLYQSYGLQAPTITNQGEWEDAANLLKTIDVNKQRSDAQDLRERRFLAQQQQFIARLGMMQQAVQDARNFRLSLMTEKNPQIKVILSQLDDLSNAIVKNLATSPEIREGLKLDEALAVLQAQQVGLQGKLDALRSQPTVQTPTGAKPPSGANPTSNQEKADLLIQKYSKKNPQGK